MKQLFSDLKETIFIGVKSVQLDDEEHIWLSSPLVSGVILFSRNYASKNQLRELCRNIKAIRSDLLISVDHEGGRVQRFREDFTIIPSMNSLGKLYDENPEVAVLEAEKWGFILASELKEVGIDFSYTPVCDLDYGNNLAIGDRAFHRDPDITATLVCALHRGLRQAESIGVAKHFPGHGFIGIDTHYKVAIDNRSLDELRENDLIPFQALIEQGVEGIMPAHIIFPCLDPDYTVVSSRIWIDYIRNDMNYNGLIFSDDLDMKGANHLGNIHKKIDICFSAGIDVALLCNDFNAIRKILS